MLLNKLRITYCFLSLMDSPGGQYEIVILPPQPPYLPLISFSWCEALFLFFTHWLHKLENNILLCSKISWVKSHTDDSYGNNSHTKVAYTHVKWISLNHFVLPFSFRIANRNGNVLFRIQRLAGTEIVWACSIVITCRVSLNTLDRWFTFTK